MPQLSERSGLGCQKVWKTVTKAWAGAQACWQGFWAAQEMRQLVEGPMASLTSAHWSQHPCLSLQIQKLLVAAA